MLFKSATMTQASGSIGGMTASHNKGGMYFRSRSIPTDPKTGRQVTIRNALAQLSQAWSNDLSQIQRDAWKLYADNVPFINALGDQITLSGQNMFIRSNVPRLQVNDAAGAGVTELPQVDNGPTVLTLPPADGLELEDVVAGAGDDIEINVATPDWAAEDNAAAIVYMGQPVPNSHRLFKGPWRYVGRILGNATTPVTGLATVPNTTGFVPTTGQHVWIRIRVSRADGRLSGFLTFGPHLVQ